MRYALCLLYSFLFITTSHAQTVSGHITTENERVPGATVLVVGTTIGTAADADGWYELDLRASGRYTLRFSAVGFSVVEHDVELQLGQRITHDVELSPMTYESGPVVVTGTMTEMGVRESPVKVEVLPARFLETVPSVNMMDSIERVNGLYQQIDCGVCYTNNIRINGIDGANTAVLIDGMPIMSSLGTVYGLNGISPMLIHQIEVVKGPMSTLYGSEAMGGVINIITKNPANTPRVTANVFGTSREEFAVEVGVVPLRGRTSTLVSGTVFRSSGFRDHNNDGFADISNDLRIALFGKTTFADHYGLERGSIAAKLYYEDRAGGVREFLASPGTLRGSEDIYGESIYTRRFELMGRWLLRPDLQLQLAANGHWQDSFYGDENYDASQLDGFSQAVYTPDVHNNHDLLIGAAIRMQRYDDNTAATGDYDYDGELITSHPDNRITPGVFVQNDWRVSDRFRFLGGLRLDWQNDYGIVPSPRAAIRWDPARFTIARFSFGTGFRIVNLFTEDHAAYSGGRATVVLEDLEPERSVSGTVSLQQIIPITSAPLVLDVDAFWTRFSNKIEPDYSVPGEIRYANLDGHATTRGFSVQAQQNLPFGLQYALGFTLLDVFLMEDGEREAIEYSPDFQGTATLTWAGAGGLVVDYTARLVGPMKMPDYEDDIRVAYEAATGSPLLERSPTYSVHNLQVSRKFHLRSGELVDVYAAVENLFDYTQSTPLVGYYDGTPGFGDSFDTEYVYGPIFGRSFSLGVRFTLRR